MEKLNRDSNHNNDIPADIKEWVKNNTININDQTVAIKKFDLEMLVVMLLNRKSETEEKAKAILSELSAFDDLEGFYQYLFKTGSTIKEVIQKEDSKK